MNIVRLAHYPHDNSFIEASDELGLIIVEEPPTWIGIGGDTWMDNLEQATRRMIRNHRNHPSILGWGAGINHRGTIKRMHFAAKEEDPTRITMNNGTLWTGEQHSGVTDLYAVMDYRGAVRPKHDLLFAMEHSGSLDTLRLQDIVAKYKADPNLIGLASWSGHDSHSFIKRDKEFPNLSVWRSASWDSFRLPKPNYYWYQSEMTYKPMIHIPDFRAQFDDQVQIFTNQEQVEVFHNGKSLGVYSPNDKQSLSALASPSILLPFVFKDGVISANALDNGKVKATHSRTKNTKVNRLQVEFDTDGFNFEADGSSIVLAHAYFLDENDLVIDMPTPEVLFSIAGDAIIVGDPKSNSMIDLPASMTIAANPVKARNGVASVLIRVGETASTLSLQAKTSDMQSNIATISLSAVSENSIVNQPTRYRTSSILMPIDTKIDFGNNSQHPQEAFYIWSQDSGPASRQIADKNGLQFGVEVRALAHEQSANPPNIAWDNHWGVPGDLSFMIEDALYSENGGALQLSLTGLPIGKYQLKTWHHVLNDKESSVPSLLFSSLQSQHQANIKSPSTYRPTFGRKIAISEAGGGEAGDGGSNTAASGYALHQFTVTETSPNVTLLIKSSNEGNVPIRLSGLHIQQLVDTLVLQNESKVL